MVISEITNALIFAFTLGALLLVGRLARVRWWRTSLGKVWAYKAVAYVGLGGLSSAGVIFGRDYVGRDVVRIIVWTVVAAIPWLTTLALDREQLRGQREKEKKEDENHKA